MGSLSQSILVVMNCCSSQVKQKALICVLFVYVVLLFSAQASALKDNNQWSPIDFGSEEAVVGTGRMMAPLQFSHQDFGEEPLRRLDELKKFKKIQMLGNRDSITATNEDYDGAIEPEVHTEAERGSVVNIANDPEAPSLKTVAVKLTKQDSSSGTPANLEGQAAAIEEAEEVREKAEDKAPTKTDSYDYAKYSANDQLAKKENYYSNDSKKESDKIKETESSSHQLSEDINSYERDLLPITYILKGVRSIVSPDLLHALASCSQTDEIAIVDNEYPVDEAKTIRLSGVPMEPIVREIMKLWKLDETNPLAIMLNSKQEASDAVKNALSLIIIAEEYCNSLTTMEKAALLDASEYEERVNNTRYIIKTSEPGPSSNIILRKGLIRNNCQQPCDIAMTEQIEEEDTETDKDSQILDNFADNVPNTVQDEDEKKLIDKTTNDVESEVNEAIVKTHTKQGEPEVNKESIISGSLSQDEPDEESLSQETSSNSVMTKIHNENKKEKLVDGTSENIEIEDTDAKAHIEQGKEESEESLDESINQVEPLDSNGIEEEGETGVEQTEYQKKSSNTSQIVEGKEQNTNKQNNNIDYNLKKQFLNNEDEYDTYDKVLSSDDDNVGVTEAYSSNETHKHDVAELTEGNISPELLSQYRKSLQLELNGTFSNGENKNDSEILMNIEALTKKNGLEEDQDALGANQDYADHDENEESDVDVAQDSKNKEESFKQINVGKSNSKNKHEILSTKNKKTEDLHPKNKATSDSLSIGESFTVGRKKEEKVDESKSESQNQVNSESMGKEEQVSEPKKTSKIIEHSDSLDQSLSAAQPLNSRTAKNLKQVLKNKEISHFLSSQPTSSDQMIAKNIINEAFNEGKLQVENKGNQYSPGQDEVEDTIQHKKDNVDTIIELDTGSVGKSSTLEGNTKASSSLSQGHSSSTSNEFAIQNAISRRAQLNYQKKKNKQRLERELQMLTPIKEVPSLEAQATRAQDTRQSLLMENYEDFQDEYEASMAEENKL